MPAKDPFSVNGRSECERVADDRHGKVAADQIQQDNVYWRPELVVVFGYYIKEGVTAATESHTVPECPCTSARLRLG